MSLKQKPSLAYLDHTRPQLTKSGLPLIQLHQQWSTSISPSLDGDTTRGEGLGLCCLNCPHAAGCMPWCQFFSEKSWKWGLEIMRLGGSYRDNILWLILAACFHAYQHDGEVYWVVVEDVSQLPGLGEESSVEETTKDLVKGFTLLEKMTVYMYFKYICM